MLYSKDLEFFRLPLNASPLDRQYQRVVIALPTTPRGEARIVEQASGLMAHAITSILEGVPGAVRALECISFAAATPEENNMRAMIVRATLEQVKGVASNHVSSAQHRTAHHWFARHLEILLEAGQFEQGAQLPTFLSRRKLLANVSMRELQECAQEDIANGKFRPEASLVFHPQVPSSVDTLRQLLRLASRPSINNPSRREPSQFPIVLSSRDGTTHSRLLGLPPISPQGKVDVSFVNPRLYPDIVGELREETEQGLKNLGVPIHALFIE